MTRAPGWFLVFTAAMIATVGAQTAPIDEAPLVKASLAQCGLDRANWTKAFDAAKLVFSGKPASGSLICAEERLDIPTLSERVRWYAYDREAARADWMQVRASFGLETFVEGIQNKLAEPDGSILLSPQDMDLANIMLMDSASLQALLDTLK